ncbi:MAG: endolytic transglycosylase MltG [Desulfobulbaceae bacterium]|nr:endolytic transglycosylase MltG [Desulfobulbaceae bacterium]
MKLVLDDNRRRGRRSRRLGRFFLLLVVLLLLGLGGWFFRYAVAPVAPDSVDERIVQIPPGATLPAIQRILAAEGLGGDGVRFRLLARLTRLERRLRAGEYQLSGSFSPLGILRELASGRIVQRPVTIPEGANLKEVASILANGGWLAREEFLSLAGDSGYIRDELRINADSLEGYLFPDTYYLTRGQKAGEIISRMVGRLRSVLAELGIGDEGRVAHGLTLHELLTMASIVEKETAAPAERPLIARVFLNRLQMGMRLQTDPTVIYGLPMFDGNLTRKDLRTATPYNTYVINGLPPGPIGNPGRASIEAVLYPASAPYLYFVSKNDSTHHFSSTLAEHNRAVQQYQKRSHR